jgi:ABC-type enterochelin transport system permease subunit
VAKEKSFVAFSILSLYTTIVGPILFFGLILAPYIFTNAWSGMTGGIISLLVSFFPIV